MSQLDDLFRNCADVIQRTCIEQQGFIVVPASADDKQVFSRTPLLTDLVGTELVDLTELPSLVYSSDPLTEEQVTDTWNFVYEAYRGSRAVRGQAMERLKVDLPSMANLFVGSLETAMIRYLKVASFQMGKFSANRTEAVLKVRAGRLGVSTQSIESPGRRWRMPDPLPCGPMQLLRAKLAGVKTSRPKTGAVYHYLVHTFPEHAAAFDALFSAAVYAGGEDVLTAKFDIEHANSRPASVSHEMFVRLKSIINQSGADPLLELKQTLVPLFGHAVFASAFRRRKPRSAYTEEHRSLDRAGLIAIKSPELMKVRNEEIDDKRRAAGLVLSFQQQIR